MLVGKTNDLATAMLQSQANWDRKAADFYPSPVDVTESIMPVIEVIQEHKGFPLKIWEPACGDGRMSRVLEWHGYEVFSSDLREHSGYGVSGIDFLAKDVTETMGWDARQDIDLIISNPPFSLAKQFIEKALEYTPNVMMLVKTQYWNAKTRKALFDAHRPSFYLPLTWRPSFLELERGNNPLMDVAWCVWTDSSDKDCCSFEPISKRVYPGYASIGSLAALDVLSGEIQALSSTLARRL